MLNPFLALQALALDLTDRLKRDEKGATAVEYALIVAAVAAVIVAAMATFGDSLGDLFGEINLGGGGGGGGGAGAGGS